MPGQVKITTPQKGTERKTLKIETRLCVWIISAARFERKRNHKLSFLAELQQQLSQQQQEMLQGQAAQLTQQQCEELQQQLALFAPNPLLLQQQLAEFQQQGGVVTVDMFAQLQLSQLVLSGQLSADQALAQMMQLQQQQQQQQQQANLTSGQPEPDNAEGQQQPEAAEADSSAACDGEQDCAVTPERSKVPAETTGKGSAGKGRRQPGTYHKCCC